MAKIEIEYVENGPNVVKKNGNVEMALCRCGGSSSKPFCDGTHAQTGFKAKGGVLVVEK